MTNREAARLDLAVVKAAVRFIRTCNGESGPLPPATQRAFDRLSAAVILRLQRMGLLAATAIPLASDPAGPAKMTRHAARLRALMARDTARRVRH